MKRILSCMLPGLLLLSVVLFTSSCGKDGDTGPQGETGPAGAAGSKGDKGDAGTANVIYSDWLDVSFLPDTVHNTDGTIDTVGFYADIDADKLDADILNSGEIKVYVNGDFADDPTVYPLPYYNAYTKLYISAYFFPNTIELYANADVSTGVPGAANYQQYRYGLIPGGTAASQASPVAWKDSTAVQAYLGLKN